MDPQSLTKSAKSEVHSSVNKEGDKQLGVKMKVRQLWMSCWEKEMNKWIRNKQPNQEAEKRKWKRHEKKKSLPKIAAVISLTMISWPQFLGFILNWMRA